MNNGLRDGNQNYRFKNQGDCQRQRKFVSESGTVLDTAVNVLPAFSLPTRLPKSVKGLIFIQHHSLRTMKEFFDLLSSDSPFDAVGAQKMFQIKAPHERLCQMAI